MTSSCKLLLVVGENGPSDRGTADRRVAQGSGRTSAATTIFSKCFKVQVRPLPTTQLQCQHAQFDTCMFSCVLICKFDVCTCRKSSTCLGSLGFQLLKSRWPHRQQGSNTWGCATSKRWDSDYDTPSRVCTRNCSMDKTLNMQCVCLQNRHATQPRLLGISQAGKTRNRRIISCRLSLCILYVVLVCFSRPGACLVVSGPGLIHALGGMANANMNCW